MVQTPAQSPPLKISTAVCSAYFTSDFGLEMYNCRPNQFSLDFFRFMLCRLEMCEIGISDDTDDGTINFECHGTSTMYPFSMIFFWSRISKCVDQ